MGRLTWIAVGFGLGVAATNKATRGGRAPALATGVATAAGVVRRRIDTALAEGRVEMREREARLRDVFAAGAPAERSEPVTPGIRPRSVAATQDENEHAPRFRGRGAGDRR